MSPDLAPRVWHPPRDLGLTGPFSANGHLAGAELWPVPGRGPEDVVVDGDGRLLCGIEDGRILRFPAGGGVPETLADTGGRPLGLELHPEGGLVVCDARRGLLRVHDGRIEVLADRFEGQRLRFVNNAAVARDGTVYFTDSSRRFGLDDYRREVLEHSAGGRLFRLEPSGVLELLLDGLAFANGVALEGDQTWLLVAETAAYRIRRLHLRGPRVGTAEVFVENLPALPDNLATGSEGVFWAAMASRRSAVLDRLLPHPRLRRLVDLLPEALQPQPVCHGIVFGFDASGRLVHNLQDPSGRLSMITGVREHDGRLYLGSLTDVHVGRVDLPGRLPGDAGTA